MHDLKYFEQNVNNRFGTSAAPAIDASLLPETAADVRLKWRKIPRSDVSIFEDGGDRIICERVYFDGATILRQVTGAA